MNKPTLRTRTAMLAALSPFFTISAAMADDFNVTSTADDGGPNTLRSAIITANNIPGSDTIFIPVGVITLTSGLPPLGDGITIVGAGPADSIVEGSVIRNDPSVDWRIFGVAPGNTVTLRDLTIRHGVCEVQTGFTGFGGGIRNGGTMTLDNVLVADNNVRILGVSTTKGSESQGGGISNNGTMTILNSTISGNVITGGVGLGEGGDARGGGIHTVGGTTLTMINSTISGNSAGGGTGVTAGGDAHGGGIFVESPANVIITRCTVYNKAVQGGDGTVGDSGKGMGGGIAAVDDAIEKVRLRLCTISGNNAGPVEGQGGGIYTGAGMTIDSCTITNNTAASENGGGGVAVPPIAPPIGPAMRNTILSGNFAFSEEDDLRGYLLSKGFNLVGFYSITVGDFDEDGVDAIATGNFTGAEARVKVLGDYGGPTFTHELLQSSLAYNHGTNDFIVGDFTATDQRGFPRSASAGLDPLRGMAIPDIGSYELQGVESAVGGAFDLYE